METTETKSRLVDCQIYLYTNVCGREYCRELVTIYKQPREAAKAIQKAVNEYLGGYSDYLQKSDLLGFREVQKMCKPENVGETFSHRYDKFTFKISFRDANSRFNSLART